MIKQAAKFGLVGVIATLVHMAVGSSLILLSLGPTTANYYAFLTAFGVSFVGHFNYTFRVQAGSRGQALRRFIAVALVGFLVSQSLLMTLVYVTEFHSVVCLLISTSVAATCTFALSKTWAFA